jgi:hypothetical protein
MEHQYQLVVLQNPYLSIDKPSTSAMFAKMASLKIQGYVCEYGNRVMPVDEYDLFGTNLLLCEWRDGELTPLSGTKIIKSSQCRFFRRPFPPVELVRSGGDEVCLLEMEKMVADLHAKGDDISYDYAWTVLPELRRSERSAELKETLLGLWALYHADAELENFFVSGTLKVKTDKFFLSVGCSPVIDGSYYYLRGINDEKALMMRSRKFPEWVDNLAEKHRDLWDRRIVIGEELQPQEQLNAA